MNLSKHPAPAPHTSPEGRTGGAALLAYRRPKITFRPMAALGWFLVTFILATGPLQLAVSDQSGRAYFSAAALGAFAVIGALVGADLRRARAMTRAGIEVERIEVGLLRGRIISTGEVTSPRDLRRVSWAGPRALGLAALALAALGGLLSVGASTGISLLAAAAFASAVGVAALAASELLPAPGTAGSQLIFARSWLRTGQRETGLVAAGRAGVVSGWFLVVAGLAVVTLVSLGGLWLMVIGATVIGGSRLMLVGARTRQQLAGLRVSDVMSSAPPEVSSFATAEVAFTDVALPSRATTLIVREPDGSFGGVVDVAALARVPGDEREDLRVRRLAVPPSALATVMASEPIERVLEQLAAHPAGGLAIVFADPSGDPNSTDSLHLSVVGVITAADLARTVELMGARARG